MLKSANSLRILHKYPEIWQIPHFYEILSDKIQDREIYLFSFSRKNTEDILLFNIAVLFGEIY